MEDCVTEIAPQVQAEQTEDGTCIAPTAQPTVVQAAQPTVEPSAPAEPAPAEPASAESASLAIPDDERRELLQLFTEEDVSAVTEEDTVRYLSLRTLGLSPKEAYLAANGEKTLALIDGKRKALARLFSEHSASKAHVTSAALGAAASASAMPRDALLEARALFSGMSDREIERLYFRAKSGN